MLYSSRCSSWTRFLTCPLWLVLRQVLRSMVQKTVVLPQLHFIDGRRHPLSFRRGRSPWSSLFSRPQSFPYRCSISGGRCPCYAGRAVSPMAENCGYSAVAVHHGRRHSLRDAEADPHFPCDHGESPVACGQGGRCPYYAGRAGHWRSLRDTEVDPMVLVTIEFSQWPWIRWSISLLCRTCRFPCRA